MKLSLLSAIAVAAALAAAPALAVPFCTETGVTLSFGFHIGEKYTSDEIAQFDLMRLRRAGVDTDRVERWNGCMRAYVRGPDGGITMRFFDPDTLQEVY